MEIGDEGFRFGAIVFYLYLSFSLTWSNPEWKVYIENAWTVRAENIFVKMKNEGKILF